MIPDDKDKEIDVKVEGEQPDIEVTIEGEGAPEGGDEKKPAPKRSRVQGRMNALRAQATQAEERARNAETTTERLRRENEELKQNLQTVDTAAFDNYASSVKANLDNAKAAYKKAREDGDVDKEVEAAAEVGKWSGEQKRVDDWRASQTKRAEAKPKDEGRQPEQRQEQRQEERREVSPEVQAWVDDNPWFNPKSPDFDQEMHLEAVEFAQVLERRLTRQGKQNEIGSAAYWEQVNKHVRAEFPDYFEGETEGGDGDTSRIPKMERDRTVTPIRSRSTPGGDGDGRQGGPRKVVLTADQADFVRSMVDNGSPAYVQKDGKPMTYEQAYKKFGLALIKDKEQQKERRVTA